MTLTKDERRDRRELGQLIRKKRKMRIKKKDRDLVFSFYNYTDMSSSEFKSNVDAQISILAEDLTIDNDTYELLIGGKKENEEQRYEFFKLKTKGGDSKPQQREWEGWDSFSSKEKEKGVIHVFVVKDLPKDLGHGYARPGWIVRDGPDIVIRAQDFGRGEAPFDNGKVMTHLLGNYLGLIPLAGWGECLDDGVDDTPIHNSPLTVCGEDFKVTSTCDYQIMLSDNFMSHTADACKSKFTIGQWKRMSHVLELINQKNKG